MSEVLPVTLYRETILFADEEELFCEGLHRLMRFQDSFEIIGVASDWLEAASKARTLEPDIVILNVRVMHTDWIETCRKIRQELPYTTIIVVSESRLNVKEALRAGVNGLVSRDIPFEEFLKILGSINENRTMDLCADLDDSSPATRTDTPRIAGLSNRERDVLMLLARGFQNKEIAGHLSIQTQTVNNHLQNIFRKLGCSNRTEAVLAAVQHGIIDLAK